MRKINELTDLRAIAILLLFLSHSNIEISAPVLEVEITQWFLSAFFFVSGFLTETSFNNKQQKIKNFLLHRFSNIYLPFISIMAFFVLTDNIVYYSPSGFLTHATFLSIFQVFSEGPYDMHQFWFIPVLLTFIVFFVFLYKYVKRASLRLLVLFSLFILNLINYAYVTPFQLQWNFGFYLLVFWLGYEISKNNVFQKMQKPWILCILALVAVSTAYFNLFVPFPWDTSTEIGRAVYFSYRWIENTVFSVSSIILVLTLLSKLRRNFGKNRIYVFTGILGSCTLYIYFWEGFVSTRLSLLVFGTTFYYGLSGSLLFVSVILRIIVVTPIAFGCLKLQNKITNFIQKVRRKQNEIIAA